MQISRIDQIAAALFLCFGGWIILRAADYGIVSPTGPGSGTFPLVAGVFIVVFSAGILLREFVGRPGLGGRIAAMEVVRIATIVAMIGVYIALFGRLGAFLPLPLLMMGISLVVHPRFEARWLATLLAITVVFSVACYFIFAVFLRVLLPEGPLGF